MGHTHWLFGASTPSRQHTNMPERLPEHRAGRPLRILQINTLDLGGGAEKVAWNLFRAYRQRGMESWLAVGNKRSNDPGVLPINTYERASEWERGIYNFRRLLEPWFGKVRGVARLRNTLDRWSNLRRWRDRQLGYE